MTIAEIVKRNRSYRRFRESKQVSRETLISLVELARYSASSRNVQPLKYYISNTRRVNNRIFELLSWAGYLRDWSGPVDGERPSAYIIIFGDKQLAKVFDTDVGIAAQSILLGAVDLGYGGCMIASVNRTKLRKVLTLPEYLQVQLVIALGVPVESVVVEDVDETGDIHYWRDEKNVHHVPKRSLKELIINFNE